MHLPFACGQAPLPATDHRFPRTTYLNIHTLSHLVAHFPQESPKNWLLEYRRECGNYFCKISFPFRVHARR